MQPSPRHIAEHATSSTFSGLFPRPDHRILSGPNVLCVGCRFSQRGVRLFAGIPYVDRIAYRIDMRERAMAIAPQSAITKDNVSVDVSGILYIQVGI